MAVKNILTGEILPDVVEEISGDVRILCVYFMGVITASNHL
jgi:hypothetical protein